MKKKLIKQVLALGLIISMLGSGFMNGRKVYAQSIFYAEDNRIEEQEILVMETECFQNYGAPVKIHGKIKKVTDVSELYYGIINALGEQAEVYENYIFQNSSCIQTENLYSENQININAGTVKTSNVIVAENNISYQASTLQSDDFTVIYSKNGNINFQLSDMTFQGILYAPNGTISFSGSNIQIQGMVIGKKVQTQTGNFEVFACEQAGLCYEYLTRFKNEDVILLEGGLDEEEILVNEDGTVVELGKTLISDVTIGFFCNQTFRDIEVYTRYEGEDEFIRCGVSNSNEYTIKNVNTTKIMDIVAVGTTIYGETIESNLISMARDIEGNYVVVTKDSDGDKIEDGVEIWFLNSNPYNTDTDGDGFSDYEESFYLCTSPTKWNEDTDSDGDGIYNQEELQLGTNPFLKDSDFDGKLDNMDEKPLQFDGIESVEPIEELPVGRFDKVTMYTDSNGNMYQYVYNYFNDDIKYAMENGEIRRYFYDKEENLTAIVYTDKMGVSKVNTYTYEDGILTSISNHGYRIDMEINEQKENIERVTIAGKEYARYKEMRNGANVQEKIIYGNGDCLEKKYEGDSIFQISWNQKPYYSYLYDEENQLKGIRNYMNQRNVSYSYNEEGNLLQSEWDNGDKIAYEYHDNSYLTIYDSNQEQKIQKIIYHPEMKALETGGEKDEGTSATIGDNASALIDGTWTYEEVGDDYYIRHIGDKLKTIYQIKDDRIEKITYPSGREEKNIYDANKRLTQVWENGKLQKSYTYNERGELIREDNKISEKTIQYTYDSYKNIIEVKEYPYTVDEPENMICKREYHYQDEWTDVLTGIDEEQVLTDEIGNPLKYFGNQLDWQGRNLKHVETMQGNINYTYDADGFRVQKIVKDKRDGIRRKTSYLIEGGDVIAETTDGKTTWYIYDGNGDVIGYMENGDSFYYEKNSQNDIISILNAQGEIICHYEYDAWGNMISVSGDTKIAEKNPFRYRSYYYDSETGWYYLRSRYYDSRTRRFLNADDVLKVCEDEENLNFFAYCGNDPVNYEDASGYGKVFIRIFASKEVILEPKKFGYQALLSSCHQFVDNNQSGGKVYSYAIDSVDKFVQYWNALPLTTILIINTHGNYKQITCAGDKGITVSKAKKLDKKHIRIVWILSCDAGHSNYTFDNIAYAISQKIYDGVVVAADGLVHYASSGKIAAYNVQKDKIPKSNRNYYGWVIYKKISGEYNCYTTTFGRMAVTLKQVTDYLLKCKLITY